MNKPNMLIQLLTELKSGNLSTSVVTISTSNATVNLSGEPEGIALTSEDCELLFDSPETVQQFYEALNRPADASLELHNVVVEDEVLETLMQVFTSVDEV
jgi:hypothetical protein